MTPGVKAMTQIVPVLRRDRRAGLIRDITRRGVHSLTARFCIPPPASFFLLGTENVEAGIIGSVRRTRSKA